MLAHCVTLRLGLQALYKTIKVCLAGFTSLVQDNQSLYGWVYKPCTRHSKFVWLGLQALYKTIKVCLAGFTSLVQDNQSLSGWVCSLSTWLYQTTQPTDFACNKQEKIKLFIKKYIDIIRNLTKSQSFCYFAKNYLGKKHFLHKQTQTLKNLTCKKVAGRKKVTVSPKFVSIRCKMLGLEIISYNCMKLLFLQNDAWSSFTVLFFDYYFCFETLFFPCCLIFPASLVIPMRRYIFWLPGYQLFKHGRDLSSFRSPEASLQR